MTTSSKGRACALFRMIIPPTADIEIGPPVARVLAFAAAMLSLAMVVAYLFGVPTATAYTLPLFIPPIVLLALRPRWVVVFGFIVLTTACVGSAAAAWFVPDLLLGQRIRSTVVWIFLGWNFLLCSRMVLARGVRR
jgi:hypothetical protein